MPKDIALRESPSQTAGPYVHIGCVPNFVGISGVYPTDLGSAMIGKNTKGQSIKINGCVFDGDGEPLRDAMVEIWQADADGLYYGQDSENPNSHNEFIGWGRQPADLETGRFTFETIKPGQVAFADGQLQAPHVNIWIVARGINLGLSTRVYFSDEEAANAVDPVLNMLAQNRAETLIAKLKDDEYRIDIHLQGEQETVFFDA